jgi:hypothetical protein
MKEARDSEDSAGLPHGAAPEIIGGCQVGRIGETATDSADTIAACQRRW